MAMLQCYVDDSGSQPADKVFVLAGFVARADAWAKFSDDWQNELDRAPGLEYFKLTEASRLQDQFHKRRGWNAEKRDDCVERLASIIAEHAALKIHVAMRHDHFEQHLKTIPVPNRGYTSDYPYPTMFAHIVSMLIMLGGAFPGLNEPCEFIFDEQQGFKDEVRAMWPSIKVQSAPYAKRYGSKILGSHEPTFRDDKKVLPLQAADLLAGSLRRDYARAYSTWGLTSRARAALGTINPFGELMSEAAVLELRRGLLAMSELVQSANPGMVLRSYDKDATPRERKKQRHAVRTKTKASSEKKRS